jgi:hypothetical protein
VQLLGNGRELVDDVLDILKRFPQGQPIPMMTQRHG